jgi:hypothetical protein
MRDNLARAAAQTRAPNSARAEALKIVTTDNYEDRRASGAKRLGVRPPKTFGDAALGTMLSLARQAVHSHKTVQIPIFETPFNVF